MTHSRLPVLRFLAVSIAFLVSSVVPALAGDSTPSPPAPSAKPWALTNIPDNDRFEFGYETAGAFGNNNPNNYVIQPNFLVLRWQPRKAEQFFHTPFIFIHQFDVDAAVVPFIHGAENHYFGIGVGTRLIYTMPGSRWSVFVGGKLYVGFIDSTGPPYGQGQDLTFSPIVDGGVLYQVTKHQKVGVSLLYEHFSNAGMSEPEVKNVGLNTIGPKIEWNISF